MSIVFAFRFVLFKTHYDRYLHLSKKYEEARNIAYYLEEKYHEIKVSFHQHFVQDEMVWVCVGKAGGGGGGF